MKGAEDGEGGGGHVGDKISKSEKDQVGWLSVVSRLRSEQQQERNKGKEETTVGFRVKREREKEWAPGRL